MNRPVRTHRNLGRFLVDSDSSIWLFTEFLLSCFLFKYFASFGKGANELGVPKLLDKVSIIYAFIFALFALGLGLFERENRFNRLRSLQLIIASNLLAIPVGLFSLYILTFEQVGRWSLVLGSLGTCTVLYLSIHFLGSYLLKLYPHRFVFIGELSTVGEKLLKVLKSTKSPQFEHATDLSALIKEKILEKTTNFDELVSQLREEGVSVITFNWQSNGNATDSAFLLAAIRQGLRVVEDAKYYAETTRQIPVSSLSDSYILKMGLDIHRPIHGLIKRLIDILICIPALVLFLIFFPFIAILIKLESKGPVLYIQKRIGRFGHEFSLIKLRTMSHQKSSGTYFTSKGDPRVTKIGKILRITHFDEIPQLWNILRGDMSIVGPRPLAIQMVLDAQERIPVYNLRHIVRPGLTGLAQILQGQTSSDKEELEEKLAFDLFYVKNFSIYFDFWIISRTVFRLMSSTW